MIEFLITSSLLILSVMLIGKAFGGKLPATARYALWLLALVRLALPVGLPESPLNIMNAVNAISWNAELVKSTTDDVYAVFPQAARTDERNAAPNLWLAAPENDPAPITRIGGPQTVAARGISLETLLLWAWGIGAALTGLWFIAVNLRFERSVKQTALLLETRARLPVYTAEGLTTPCLLGLLKPAIYLPKHIAANEDMRRHSIAHEQCHHSHGDHIFAWVRIFFVSIYWFHPLVWAAALLSKRDCELSCDEAAIRKLGEDERVPYGNTLIALAAHPSGYAPRFCTAATMQTGKARLRERITNISKPKRMRVSTALLLAAACVLLVSCTISSPIAEEAPATPMVELKAASIVEPAADNAALTAKIDPAALPADAVEPSERLSFHTTSYPGSDATMSELEKNRCFNIEKAAAMLDEIIVMPGETFSFNEAIGARTVENGWKNATEEINGVYISVPGNGVCQASTALYNALLKAGLAITERRSHPAPQNYAERGLDATVDDDGLDLKFRNDKEAAIRLAARVYPDPADETQMLLTIEIYGALSKGASYSLRSVTISEEEAPEDIVYQDDPTLPLGMEEFAVIARNGYEVEVYRDAYQNGVLVSSELLYMDRYKSNPPIFRRGTKTPRLLTDMTEQELADLAGSLFEAYVRDDATMDFDAVGRHYASLFRLLELEFGGIMQEGAALSFTVGVPMAEFEAKKCYPYAALIFALDSNASAMSVGRPGSEPEDALDLSRADVESHYRSVLDQPLDAYADNEEALAELLRDITL